MFYFPKGYGNTSRPLYSLAMAYELPQLVTTTRFSETSVVFDGYILVSLWALVVVCLSPHSGLWRDKVKTRFVSL